MAVPPSPRTARARPSLRARCLVQRSLAEAALAQWDGERVHRRCGKLRRDDKMCIICRRDESQNAIAINSPMNGNKSMPLTTTNRSVASICRVRRRWTSPSLGCLVGAGSSFAAPEIRSNMHDFLEFKHHDNHAIT